MKRLLIPIVPHVCGPFTFQQTLRRGLRSRGWDVCGANLAVDRSDFSLLGHGSIPLGRSHDPPEVLAQRLHAHLIDEAIDVFMPMANRVALSVVPHLPTRIRVIQRCSVIETASYRRLLSPGERVELVFTSSLRQQQDMLETMGLSEERLAFIPHSIRNDPDAKARTTQELQDRPLRLAFLGRLSQWRKNIFLLRPILDLLVAEGIPHTLDIIGGGDDEQALRMLLAPHTRAGRVHFHGMLSRSEFNPILDRMDIALFPSRTEGFGFVAIEAMARGAVPIVSEIPGVFSWIVRDGETGFVVPQGDERAFVDRIALLHRDRTRIAALSEATLADCRARFELETMLDRWAEALDGLVAHAPQPGLAADLPWSEWTLPELRPPRVHVRRFGLPEALRARVPERAKDLYKVARFWEGRLRS